MAAKAFSIEAGEVSEGKVSMTEGWGGFGEVGGAGGEGFGGAGEEGEGEIAVGGVGEDAYYAGALAERWLAG